MPRKTKQQNTEPDDIIFKTHVEIAQHYGVTRKCVNDWANEANPMPGKRPEYRKSEIDKWLETRPRARQNREKQSLDGSDFLQLSLITERAKARKETALADQHEIKAKLIDPRFVPASEVNQLFTEFFVELRRNMVAIPVDLAASYPQSIRVDLQKDLKQRLDLLLNQMGDFVERFNRSRKVIDALGSEPEHD